LWLVVVCGVVWVCVCVRVCDLHFIITSAQQHQWFLSVFVCGGVEERNVEPLSFESTAVCLSLCVCWCACVCVCVCVRERDFPTGSYDLCRRATDVLCNR